MSDAERDAWLREALRHAPDSGALPPRELSETILASARAATRSAQGLPAHRASHTEPKHPLAAFWDWLARPSVAAGFASVLAATLVGLMWWDRPMDEMLARRPEVARESAAPATPGAIVRPLEMPAPSAARLDERSAAAPAAPAPPAVSAAPNPAAANDATRSVLADRIDARRQRLSLPSDQGAARDAKVAPSTNATGELKGESPVPAAQQEADSKREAPTPFPRGDLQRSAPATQALPEGAKKDIDRTEPAPREEASAPPPASRADAPPPAAAPLAKAQADTRTALTAAPTAPMRSVPATPPPLAGGRLENDEQRAATANSAGAEKAKTGAGQPALRQGTLDGTYAKEASAFASSGATMQRRAIAAEQRTPAGAAGPLAPLFAAIGVDSAQWSRVKASGAIVTLDAGWRDWLQQLDAAATGHWSTTGSRGGSAEGERAREGVPTLRLIARDRSTLVVRLEGSTASVEGAAGERWQAKLAPEAAERLRASAERQAR